MSVKEKFKTRIGNGVRRLDSLFPEQQKDTSSIFDYYSVANEIEFARESRLPVNDVTFYIEENVHRFLGEFAGRVAYADISFIMKNGALTYRGIDLTPSYERTAQNGERESDEYVGYSRIQNALAQGAGSALWINPPKDADYGFVFYFVRDKQDSDKIREHIIRYDEQRGDLSVSKNILQKIYDKDKDSVGFQSDRDFVRKPIIGATDPQPESDLQIILSSMGVDKKQIDDSLRFEKRTRDDLVGWVRLYSSAVLSGDIDFAEKLLLAIYNYAFDTRRNILQFSADPAYPAHLSEERFNYYASQKRTVTAGSCPVSQNSFSDPFAPTSLVDKLLNGKTINGIASEAQNFVCPNCEHRADGPVGNQCPGCNITREEWAEKGNRVC